MDHNHDGVSGNCPRNRDQNPCKTLAAAICLIVLIVLLVAMFGLLERVCTKLGSIRFTQVGYS